MYQDKLIAYNSKVLPLILALLAIILIPIGYFAVKDLSEYRLPAILFFVITISIFLICFLYFISLPSVSFEIKNEIMYIYHHHNKETIVPLSGIIKVVLCDDSSSFDARIHCIHGKIGLHRMIKNKKEVYQDFVELIMSNNIPVEYYSMSM